MCIRDSSISEKAGAQKLIERIKSRAGLMELCRKIKLVWADGGYQGDDLLNWVRDLVGWVWSVVLRPQNSVGFVLLPRRWVVERTFSWLFQARRLSKDYEKNVKNSESVVYLAMIRIMIRRLWGGFQTVSKIKKLYFFIIACTNDNLSLIHIWRCRRAI